jgi:putative ABC transport system permease protein
VIAWTSDLGAFDRLQVPETTASEAERLEPTIERIAEVAVDPTLVPLDLAVDPSNSEIASGETLLNIAHLGRPVDEDTLRDAGPVYVATPEVLVYLGIDPASVEDGTLLLTPQAGDVFITGNISDTTFRREPVPDAAVDRLHVPAHTSAPRTLLTQAGLDAAHLVPMRAGWLIETAEPVGSAALARMRTIAADAGLAVEVRDEHASLTTIRTAASAAGVLVALGILALTVGLLRSDAAGDLRTLTASGATSRTRRALTASTAGVLAALGIGLGIGIAYVTLVAGYWPETERLRNVPVAELTAMALGLPLLASTIGWTVAGGAPGALARQPTE